MHPIAQGSAEHSWRLKGNLDMALPPERRDQLRRTIDRAADDLQNTFCSCLDCMADGVLLLDNAMQVIYATPQVDKILKSQDEPFAILPKFILHAPHQAARFAAFVNGKHHETGPLSLLLEGKNELDLLLITCFYLPKSSDPDLHVVRYLITLRDPNNYSTQH